MTNGTKLPPPMPMAGPDQPVEWMFAYKFNAHSFPGYDNVKDPPAGVEGRFGGKTKDYKNGMSQNYVFATSDKPELVRGKGRLGDSYTDPLSTTFAQVYDTEGYYYILWNDQFYDNPIESKEGPHGHSKGMAAWNEDGEGFVLQVSTPSWPASGSREHSRNSPDTKKPDSNTLGCVNDDDIEVAQHFFCLHLKDDDLLKVLTALGNASVVTDPKIPALCNNGGPKAVQDAVNKLGGISRSKQVYSATLSSGVRLISKASHLNVPPWQMVSAALDGLDLRAISWWANPEIYSTKGGKKPGCWATSLGTPGDVEIALSGQWDGVEFSLKGGNGEDSNHAKIGIAQSASSPVSIFGDENQQGALCEYNYKDSKGKTHTKHCDSSQNGRGGTFYVVENEALHKSLTSLFKGESADLDTECKS